MSTVILSSLPLVPANAQNAVAHLAVSGGNGQVACECSSTTLQAFQPISVKAIDAFGNPVAGATVAWVVTSGQATAGTGASVTDATGVASNTLKLVVFDNQSTAAVPYLVSTIQAVSNGNSVVFVETQSLLQGGNSVIQATAPTLGGGSLSQSTLSANAGAVLPTPIQVHVASGGGVGSGVPNVSVRLINAQASPAVTCAYQGGYADPGSVLTDLAGDAKCYPLFNGSGTGTFNVLVGAAQAASTSSAAPQGLQSFGPFTFNSLPGAPVAVEILSGNNQVGGIGQTLNPMVAKVVDANGNAVQGQTVVWTMTPAGAVTLSSIQTVTDNSGEVSAFPTLSETASGAVQVNVALKNNSSISATFQLSPTGIVTNLVKISGDNQTAAAGTNFFSPLIVQVNNASGPVANFPVQFTANGNVSVTNSTVYSDAGGRASIAVKAGTLVGPATVTAIAAQYTLTFNLTVSYTSPTQPNGLTIVSGNLQTAIVGSAFSAPLVVEVNSLAGPVAGATVNFSTTGPVTISASAVTSNVNGQAQITAQAGSAAGAATVSANVTTGIASYNTTFTLTVAPNTSSTSPVSIFGSGHVAGKSNLATPGTVDGNFTLLSCPTGACVSNTSGGYNAYVTLTGQYPFPTWLANPSSAQWIGPARGGNEMTVDASGLYVYRQTFDLTGFNLGTVVLNGSFAIDDQSGSIKLNGVTVGPTSTSLSSLTPFTLSSGFVPGKNTIDFLVTNGPAGGIYNPTGLLVELSGAGALAATGPPPTITAGGIVPVYSPVGTVQSGEWVSIYGTNLASSTVTWNGNFPQSLGGTTVTVDGRAAYLWYVSPTQINLQTPDDPAIGPVPVVVTTPNGTAAATVTMAQYAPSFLLLDSKHVAGIILRQDGSGAYGGGSYDILGPTGTALGYPTVAAKAGDSVALFAVGLGPTSPVVEPGQAFSGAAQTTSPVTLQSNKVGVAPAFTGLTGAGLYQINLTVPAGLATGDVPLVAFVETTGGAQTPPNVVISLQ